jgi:hypothetical protein
MGTGHCGVSIATAQRTATICLIAREIWLVSISPKNYAAVAMAIDILTGAEVYTENA